MLMRVSSLRYLRKLGMFGLKQNMDLELELYDLD